MAQNLPLAYPNPQAWAPKGKDNEAHRALLVVQLPPNQERLTATEYLSLLTWRLEWLLNQQKNPRAARQWLLEEFRSAGLADHPVRLDNSLDLANDLVFDNLSLHAHLQRLAELPLHNHPVSPSREALRDLRLTRLPEWSNLATRSLRVGNL